MTNRAITADSDLGVLRFDPAGLIPVVCQDAVSGQVLMVAWANIHAIEWSLESGQMHFWSRSRGELWKKGESSGNTLSVRTIHADCDGDTLLALVDPAGPACHTGETTCFGSESSALVTERSITIEPKVSTSAGPLVTPPPLAPAMPLPDSGIEQAAVAGPEGEGVLDELWEVIQRRASDPPEESYTARLLSDRNLVVKKLGEETAEVILAFADGGPEGVTREGADLIYHLLVALAASGSSLAAVREELARRRT